MSSCLCILLNRGLRPLFFAALAVLAWLVFGAGTASAAPVESSTSLTFGSGAVTSDHPAGSSPSMDQVLPASPVNTAPPVGEVAAAPVAEVVDVVTPVTEVAAAPVAEVIAAPVAEVVVTPVTEVLAAPVAEVVDVVESGTVGLVGTVEGLVGPPVIPLPEVPLGLPALQPLRGPIPMTLETAPVPLQPQQAQEEGIFEAAPGPTVTLTASEGPYMSASALFAATAPPAASAGATTYSPTDNQPAPIPFLQAGYSGLSASGSSGNGGIAAPGAADVPSAWSVPPLTDSGQIPGSTLLVPPAPSFDPGSRPD
jgi:hypothetical protein